MFYKGYIYNWTAIIYYWKLFYSRKLPFQCLKYCEAATPSVLKLSWKLHKYKTWEDIRDHLRQEAAKQITTADIFKLSLKPLVIRIPRISSDYSNLTETFFPSNTLNLPSCKIILILRMYEEFAFDP